VGVTKVKQMIAGPQMGVTRSNRSSGSSEQYLKVGSHYHLQDRQYLYANGIHLSHLKNLGGILSPTPHGPFFSRLDFQVLP